MVIVRKTRVPGKNIQQRCILDKTVNNNMYVYIMDTEEANE